jgi:tRNA nucleotidyltransferase (CCA-adding enzyme)
MFLTIFCQENLPFELNLLPETAYLVGGAVRDALIKRQREYLDLDFVLPQDAVKIARKIANIYRAGFVVLDRERNIARIVFKNATIDIAQQEGNSLTQDLQRRDFTINAIAYNLHTQQLIDPLGGENDLKKGLIKMVSETNLKDDPLRLLRAYRQASQLNFTIEEETRLTIQKLAHNLSKIAAERIRTELGYLFATMEGSRWLKEAYDDGLLSIWLKNISSKKLENLAKIDQVATWITQFFPEFKPPNQSWYYLAKLANLVSENPEIAELELQQLKYSRAEIRTVITILKHLPQLLNLTSPLSLREQYFLFLETGKTFILLGLTAIALGGNRDLIVPLIERYLNPKDNVAHPQPLVTGNDLIKNLKLSPSRKMGKLLTEIHLAYIEGKISTKKEALDFAFRRVGKNQQSVIK